LSIKLFLGVVGYGREYVLYNLQQENLIPMPVKSRFPQRITRQFESATARSRLKPQTTPYVGPTLARGVKLMYRRNKHGAGTWVARIAHSVAPSSSSPKTPYWTEAVGFADDCEPANNDTVLDFGQAQDHAKEVARRGGKIPVARFKNRRTTKWQASRLDDLCDKLVELQKATTLHGDDYEIEWNPHARKALGMVVDAIKNTSALIARERRAGTSPRAQPNASSNPA
jgi:hypothetical protein